MQAPQDFVVTIRGRRLSHLHVSQMELVGKQLAGLLAGEGIDPDVFRPYGLALTVDPAGLPISLLEQVADWLDDGFHEKLVDELRGIAAELSVST